MKLDTEPELRASDFKKAWPTAMAVALRECGDLVAQIGETNASIQQSKNGIFKLAEMIPQFLSAAERRLDESVIRFVDQIAEKNDIALNAIKTDRVELERLRAKFIEECRFENQKLLDTASRLQKETERLEKAKVDLKNQKTEFENLSIFERVFYNK